MEGAIGSIETDRAERDAVQGRVGSHRLLILVYEAVKTREILDNMYIIQSCTQIFKYTL